MILQGQNGHHATLSGRGGGLLPEKLGGGVWSASQRPLLISD